jgi:hypothetical protein
MRATLSIENITSELIKSCLNYYLEFFDNVHLNTRLTFEIKENNSTNFIDTLSFYKI